MNVSADEMLARIDLMDDLRTRTLYAIEHTHPAEEREERTRILHATINEYLAGSLDMFFASVGVAT